MSRTDAEIDPNLPETLQLGELRFSLKTGELVASGGQSVPLRSQSAEVLTLLGRRANEVVPKQELIDTVWPDTFVTDDSLIQCIADIRRAIGDEAHLIVQTLPKKGYKLIAHPVAGPAGTNAAPPGQRPARSRLPHTALLAAAAAVLAAVFWLAFPAHEGGDPFDDVPTIAVLAFDDFSAGEDRGYLSDAIAEGVITELARSRVFRVIARNSSFQYRGKSSDIRDIGRELGSEYVLEGSQQKDGENLRVTVQLIDATNAEHIWGHTYDQKIGNLFEVQDQIIRTVADRVGRRIVRPVARGDPEKVSALHHYLEGFSALDTEFNEANNAKALKHFELAKNADPRAQFGYVGVAHYYRNAATFGWDDLDRDEALRQGFASARKALDIAPDDPAVHYILARLHTEANNVDEALASYAKAIELNPSASNYLVASTSTLLYIGKTDEAIARLEQAMGIDPFHPDWYHWQMAWALWEKEDCDGALEAMRRMKKIPRGARRMLAGIHACLGNTEKAQAAYKVFYAEAKEPTIAEQREEWKDVWTAPGSLERWLDHMRIAGMKD